VFFKVNERLCGPLKFMVIGYNLMKFPIPQFILEVAKMCPILRQTIYSTAEQLGIYNFFFGLRDGLHYIRR